MTPLPLPLPCVPRRMSAPLTCPPSSCMRFSDSAVSAWSSFVFVAVRDERHVALNLLLHLGAHLAEEPDHRLTDTASVPRRA